jgi:hypothetical protein
MWEGDRTTLFMFPPLCSPAIASMMVLAGNGEAAGVAVSIVAGSLFAISLYFAAEIVYGRRAALITGVLAASLPFAVVI